VDVDLRCVMAQRPQPPLHTRNALLAFPFGSSLSNIYFVQFHVFLRHRVFDLFCGSGIVNVFHKNDCTDLISLRTGQIQGRNSHRLFS
jgi:hypothetical protein